MHYVGIHGLAGNFRDSAPRPHDPAVDLDRDRHRLWRPACLPRPAGRRAIDRSLIAFGVAVSGMHYTAMYGMGFRGLLGAVHSHPGGLAASQQILSVVVAVLCFVIAAGFLAVAGAGSAPANRGRGYHLIRWRKPLLPRPRRRFPPQARPPASRG